MTSIKFNAALGMGLALVFTAPAQAGSVTVAKYNESVQCESIGISLITMKKELVQSKIPARAPRCGVDGMLYPQVCGGETGRLNLYDVPTQKLEQALALGFQALSDFPDAAEVPCEHSIDFNNQAASISINGIGPAVDGKAYGKVRKLIAQAVEDNVISRFIVYGYGIEGGFSACVQEGQFAPDGAFGDFINKLQTVRFNPSTTAYSIGALDECLPE